MRLSVSIAFPRKIGHTPSLKCLCVLLLLPSEWDGEEGKCQQFYFCSQDFPRHDSKLRYLVWSKEGHRSGWLSVTFLNKERTDSRDCGIGFGCHWRLKVLKNFQFKSKNLWCLAILHTDMWHWDTTHRKNVIFSSFPSWKMSLHSNKMNPHHPLVHKQADGKNSLWCPSQCGPGRHSSSLDHQGTCWETVHEAQWLKPENGIDLLIC